ncbi:YkoF-like protein [Xylaria arbuscula]|nr:YkoF-like protein [Xylaria arbuscula]
MEYTSIATPERCYADFCLIPVGTGSVSVAEEVAEVQKLLKASGLVYTMHSAGTTVEGSWDEVMRVIGQAHSVVHARGVVRVQSSMRVGTRLVVIFNSLLKLFNPRPLPNFDEWSGRIRSRRPKIR